MNHELDYTYMYKKWHSDDPKHIRKQKRYLNKTLGKFLPENREARILEIGCGMGFALLLLKDLGYTNVEGIDSDKGQVDSCLNKQLSVTRTNDAQSYLKDKTGFYDLILALDLIEHIPHESQLDFMKSVSASLKTGGVFICTVPNANSSLASRLRYICWTHKISFTEHSIDFLLYNSGFENIHIHEAGSFRRPRYVWIIRPAVFRWLLLLFFRGFRRLEMVAEFGVKEGKDIPLSINLLAIATKKI